MTTGQSEDYATSCLLDYDYIRNHHRLIAIELGRLKKLGPKEIQKIRFVEQLKKLDNNDNAIDSVNDKSMFVLTILWKIKETVLKISQGSVTIL